MSWEEKDNDDCNLPACDTHQEARVTHIILAGYSTKRQLM